MLTWAQSRSFQIRTGRNRPLTLFSGESDDVCSTFAHHLGDVERTVGLVGYSDSTIDRFGLHLQSVTGGQTQKGASSLFQDNFFFIFSFSVNKNSIFLRVLPLQDGLARGLQVQWSQALIYVSAPKTSKLEVYNLYTKKTSWLHTRAVVLYLCNYVSILSMNLRNGSKISDETENLIHLKEGHVFFVFVF